MSTKAPSRPCRFKVGDLVWSDLHNEHRPVVLIDHRRGEWHVWVAGYCRRDTEIYALPMATGAE